MVGKPPLIFNLVVGCKCVCAFTADSLVGEPIGMSDGPLLGVFIIVPYALLANVCYTGGGISELLVRSPRKAEAAAAFGLKAFRVGITFSIFITLCPAAICWLAFAVALLKARKHGPIQGGVITSGLPTSEELATLFHT